MSERSGGSTALRIVLFAVGSLLLLSCITTGLVVAGAGGLYHRVQQQKKVAISHLQLERAAQRVQLHLITEGALPESLELVFEGDAVPVDGWGGKLHYRRLDDERFELSSLGRDGAVGGRGAGTDLIVTGG